MQYLIGIDLGTTGLKAAVFDTRGNLIGRGYVENNYLPGSHGYAEQEPEMWWKGCRQAIRLVLKESRVNSANIAGIGVCGFHHCPVFLDVKGRPARPSILTRDIRLGKSIEDLRKSGILQKVIRESGSLVTTGHFPPIYHYLFKNDRGSLEKTRWIILAKDYIRYRLTGNIGTEICDATGTNLVAMPEQEWSDSLCKLLHVPREKLPDIVKSTEISGGVTKEAESSTGLKAGTPVVYGGGDSHCALLGLGVVGSGEVGLLLGTNSTLRASFKGLAKDSKHRVWIQQHVVPERWTVSASSMAGASVLTWFKETFFREDKPMGDEKAYNEIESLVSNISPGSNGLLFHPYLYGERSPFYNPNAKGAFLGVSNLHKKGHFVRSVMEGIGFCISNCLELIKDIAHNRNENIKTIRIGEGGGSRLIVWRQILSDILGLPLEVVGVEEPGCLGAALLAGVGVGNYKSFQYAIGQTVRVKSIVSPDLKNTAFYSEKKKLFNKTYGALEPILYK
jgi:xylulokinase